ncbi:UDPglucose 6-dehydrogenase [Methylophilaceae bacterium]|nr:UDPglucose 6-dehydrogenase [Methylophilaceae bacterium]
MKISVVGSGYVGLVTGTCLAEVGHHVLCLDSDPAKIELLQSGQPTIYEPGLDDLLKRNIASGRLEFTTSAEASAQFGDVQFIAVGTPPDENGSADLRHVLAAAEAIARHISRRTIIVNKSTVPVGTADQVRALIQKTLTQRNSKLPFSVVSNPEFLKEGAAIEDFMRPDRIIIGSTDEHDIDVMKALYAPFNRHHNRIITMDVRSAELTKYAANCMLAARVSFMNELANLADELGADIENVRMGIGSDPRIGYDFIYAGCGYGGSCFPKDVKALANTAAQLGIDMQMLKAAENINMKQKHVLVDKIRKRFGDDLGGMRFALWGLSFKPNTDDMREAPSRTLIDRLISLGAAVQAYDPVAMHEAQRLYAGQPEIGFADSPFAALEGADALVIVTEWKEFRAPDFGKIRDILHYPVIFDGRNLFSPAQLKQLGIEYHGIGRTQKPGLQLVCNQSRAVAS